MRNSKAPISTANDTVTALSRLRCEAVKGPEDVAEVEEVATEEAASSDVIAAGAAADGGETEDVDCEYEVDRECEFSC